VAKQPKDVQHVRLHHYLLKTSAWLGLSTAARAVYIQTALRYNGSNNGRVAFPGETRRRNAIWPGTRPVAPLRS
jgi:hypothetical protein